MGFQSLGATGVVVLIRVKVRVRVYFKKKKMDALRAALAGGGFEVVEGVIVLVCRRPSIMLQNAGRVINFRDFHSSHVGF